MDPAKLIFLFVIAYVGLILAKILRAGFSKSTVCPTCNSNNVASNPYRYKGVVCHECRKCGDHFETLPQ